MQLALPAAQQSYKSNAQKARAVTEPWAAENLFCPNCTSPRLEPTKANTPVIDFLCPRCDEGFQLKSGKSFFMTRIPDADYAKMVERIASDRAPSLFALQYNEVWWTVRNLILIPRFAYSVKDIIKRPATHPRGRSNPWVGCDISLRSIPPAARIPLIAEGIPFAPSMVRGRFGRLKPLENVRSQKRGWTLDVLLIVESLGKTEFELAEVYSHEAKLRARHLANRHVRPKIRQQLQVLRDLGFLRFLGHGRYRLP